jgi:hypothetical protein
MRGTNWACLLIGTRSPPNSGRYPRDCSSCKAETERVVVDFEMKGNMAGASPMIDEILSPTEGCKLLAGLVWPPLASD